MFLRITDLHLRMRISLALLRHARGMLAESPVRANGRPRGVLGVSMCWRRQVPRLSASIVNDNDATCRSHLSVFFHEVKCFAITKSAGLPHA